jgi:hypothetical protein
MASFIAPIMGRTALSTRDERHWQHQATNKVIRQIRKRWDTPGHTGPARRRAWTDEYLQDPERFDEIDLPAHERVTTRGEMERRKGSWGRALQELESEYERSSEVGPTAPSQATTTQARSSCGSLLQGTVI